MAPSFTDAIRMIEDEARRQATAFTSNEETVSLFKALHRVSPRTYRSPEATPKFDTSAMDGFALNSEATRNASIDSPAIFKVQGLIAAGDEPVSLAGEPDHGIYPCVEIMTGARFPNCLGGKPFDCCVRLEDTIAVTGSASNRRYIKVTKPAKYQQNRRLAGTDFSRDDVILPAGATIRHHHIMALASVGITEISVLQKPRIAVFSTGSELMPGDASKPGLHRIRDANGPYITAKLEDWGADVDFLGVLDDDADTMTENISHHLSQQKYDVIISTGAVSTGRFDLIQVGLQRLGARIVFHKIAIRPGHPALFATIPPPWTDGADYSRERRAETAFFGMPGNPVASAACLRFLFLPYLKALQLQEPERPLKATIRQAGGKDVACPESHVESSDVISTFPGDKDVFRPGASSHTSQDDLQVILIQDHSPGKIKPFLGSNCWIHIPRGISELRQGNVVDIYPSH